MLADWGVFSIQLELKGEFGWRMYDFSEKFSCQEPVECNVGRISYQEVDERAFIDRFERPNLPVVITHSQMTWDARKKWTNKVKGGGVLSACLCLRMFSY